MSDNKYIKISENTAINFGTADSNGETPKATLDITNAQANDNVAYKIKTTAPKLFVVKPI